MVVRRMTPSLYQKFKPQIKLTEVGDEDDNGCHLKRWCSWERMEGTGFVAEYCNRNKRPQTLHWKPTDDVRIDTDRDVFRGCVKIIPCIDCSLVGITYPYRTFEPGSAIAMHLCVARHSQKQGIARQLLDSARRDFPILYLMVALPHRDAPTEEIRSFMQERSDRLTNEVYPRLGFRLVERGREYNLLRSI